MAQVSDFKRGDIVGYHAWWVCDEITRERWSKVMSYSSLSTKMAYVRGPEIWAGDVDRPSVTCQALRAGRAEWVPSEQALDDANESVLDVEHARAIAFPGPVQKS